MGIGSREGSVTIRMFGLASAVLVAACSSDGLDPPKPPSHTTTPTQGAGTSGTDAGAADSGEDSAPTFAPGSPLCTSWVYSDWSICTYQSTQTRTVLSALPSGCYSGGPVLKQSCTFTAPTDGPGLYDAYCSGCHGDGKKGKSASAIQNAINGNAGGMNVLSSLTADQIVLIASAP